jgi:hypothetical protein
MAINSFNPFSLKNIFDHSQLGIKLQETVHYTESRFRAILTDISHDINMDLERRTWVQKLLRQELVSHVTLYYIHINY